MAHGVSTFLSCSLPCPHTHLSLKREFVQQLHYTHDNVSLMVSRYTTLIPSLGLHIGPACEAGLSAGMQREHVLPHRREKEKERKIQLLKLLYFGHMK